MTRSRILSLPFLLLLTLGCGDRQADRIAHAKRVTGGEPDRGAIAVQRYGCGRCHTIPGVPGAEAEVGPSLENIVERERLAGRLTNNAANLQRWIREPQSIAPGSAMPSMGINERDGRDIAAFLYTLP